MDALYQAKSFATFHHVFERKQLYGALPYTHHLAAVEAVLRSYGETRLVMRTAAWLHDVVEDTDVSVRDIEEGFGEEVARLVAAVTSERGENRKVRNALTYPKIRAAGPDAIRLKLADRIANVSYGLENGRADMYRKEHADFKHALFVHADGNEDMWRRLDEMLEA